MIDPEANVLVGGPDQAVPPNPFRSVRGCRTCSGSGRVTVVCEVCEGGGCPTCSGLGVISARCDSCLGMGALMIAIGVALVLVGLAIVWSAW
jgi:hypothetical protein